MNRPLAVGARRGTCLALFPGAFRPPHAAHYAAVRHLVTRPDVDEVVIIIARRSRHLPGTTKALEADVARDIWTIYLQDLDDVRVEIAPHSAIRHALGFFDRVNPGDRLIFCVGEADLHSGDERFANIGTLASQAQVKAEVIAAPTASMEIRATPLRESLGLGDPGREVFLTALPDHLSPEQREEVWATSQKGVREISDIVQEKVRDFIEREALGEILRLDKVKSGKLDPVFRAQLKGGQSLIVKYAGDTVDTGEVGNRLCVKPRQRLAVEYRVLRFLHANPPPDIILPHTRCFDKQTRTLALSEVCPGGRSLDEMLCEGVFDAGLVTSVAGFLAHCHKTSREIDPLWGDAESDLHHWERMLALMTTDIQMKTLAPSAGADLEKLGLASQSAAEHRLVILDLPPGNILAAGGTPGIVDLELGSSIGDPAYDLGNLLGHLMFWGIVTAATEPCRSVLGLALRAYRSKADELWPRVRGRVAAFAGATILYDLARRTQRRIKTKEDRLLNTAAVLLAGGPEPSKKVADSLNGVL